MKLLTFLGVQKYNLTTYVWGDQQFVTCFSPVAACHFLKPESLIVFLTEEAEEKVFPDLRTDLPGGLEIQPVPVSLGKDEAELWQIFDRVSSTVSPGEEVAFDITYGLRSFPLIGLLAAAFLRAGLGVSLKAVLYSAWDVRDQSSNPPRTPVFDLSPMLALLEWAGAAERFNRSGDASQLSALLDDQRKHLALSSQGDHNLLEQAGRLGNLAGALTSISQSLRLIRPHRVMEETAGLEARVRAAQPALERATAARPFNLVLENIIHSYALLAQENPLQKDHLRQTLGVERRLIRWYAEREQWVQAVSLAREWLVSWVMTCLSLTQVTQRDLRLRIENVVGAEAKDYQESKEKKKSFTSVFLKEVPDLEIILSLWLSLTKVRNDILHAGMREDPGDPQDLIRQIQASLEVIDRLPL